MDKKIVLLIILVLLVICAIGAYLIHNNDSSKNDYLSDKYPKNDSNISVNESNQEKIQSNITEIVSNNNVKYDKSDEDNRVPKIKTISSKSEVTKEANKILDQTRGANEKNVVVRNVRYEGDGLWYADFVDSKTGKKVGWTIISDKTGKMIDG